MGSIVFKPQYQTLLYTIDSETSNSPRRRWQVEQTICPTFTNTDTPKRTPKMIAVNRYDAEQPACITNNNMDQCDLICLHINLIGSQTSLNFDWCLKPQGAHNLRVNCEYCWATYFRIRQPQVVEEISSFKMSCSVNNKIVSNIN